MNVVLTVVLAVQMLSALAMIGLILVQHGKGADMGAAFGSGGSGSLFGASGSANFLSHTTAVLAAIFFVCTLALAYFGNAQPRTGSSVLEGAAVTAPIRSLRCGSNPWNHCTCNDQRCSSSAACACRIGCRADPDEIT
jgi:preprotein translocase subunit SecG